MQPIRSVNRRRLDDRLGGLLVLVGPRPGRGWIRAIRDALGMSTFELAERMGVSQPRISQYERAEVGGTIRLSTLERVAASLKCNLCYALVPEEPLQAIVHRQALEKAATTLAQSGPRLAQFGGRGPACGRAVLVSGGGLRTDRGAGPRTHRPPRTLAALTSKWKAATPSRRPPRRCALTPEPGRRIG
jgi:predicted DNA-binding mobile mystery protein A